MHADKIEAALTEALKQLDNSVKSLNGNDEGAAADSLWSASSEIEYAVFVLSLAQGEMQQHASPIGIEQSNEPSEPKLALIDAQHLIQESKTSVQSGEFGKGFEEAQAARNLLIRTQESLEKKLREKSRK
jgi:hypothetical protein